MKRTARVKERYPPTSHVHTQLVQEMENWDKTTCVKLCAVACAACVSDSLAQL